MGGRLPPGAADCLSATLPSKSLSGPDFSMAPAGLVQHVQQYSGQKQDSSWPWTTLRPNPEERVSTHSGDNPRGTRTSLSSGVEPSGEHSAHTRATLGTARENVCLTSCSRGCGDDGCAMGLGGGFLPMQGE